jgi:hypothetical protein
MDVRVPVHVKVELKVERLGAVMVEGSSCGEPEEEVGGGLGSPSFQALVRETVDTDVAPPFGAYVFAYDEPGAAIAHALEQEVFLESFGNTPAQLAFEYGAYESSSVFFCVIDHRRATIAGMMRMILPTPNGPGLKSLVDLEKGWGRPPAELFADAGLAFDPGSTWDIATLAVGREYRSAATLGLVSQGLYQSFVRTAMAVGVDSLVMILDHIVFRTLKLRVRVPFVALGDGRPYLGSSSSVPTAIQLTGWRKSLSSDPEMLGIIFDGLGIEPALTPIDLDRAMSCVSRLSPPGQAKRRSLYRQVMRGLVPVDAEAEPVGAREDR